LVIIDKEGGNKDMALHIVDKETSPENTKNESNKK
jgi:hypothetical protein